MGYRARQAEGGSNFRGVYIRIEMYHHRRDHGRVEAMWPERSRQRRSVVRRASFSTDFNSQQLSLASMLRHCHVSLAGNTTTRFCRGDASHQLQENDSYARERRTIRLITIRCYRLQELNHWNSRIACYVSHECTFQLILSIHSGLTMIRILLSAEL